MIKPALAMLMAATATVVADRVALESLLQRPILDPTSSLTEVQAFCERRIPAMPPVKSLAEWDLIADWIRRETLSRVVFRGAAAEWRRGKTNVEWLGSFPGGPGYSIRKLRYEAVPGLWIPAILYEPDHVTGRVPVVLNVNGHEPIGKSVPYKQIRCINQVRRGMIALNPEWIGMGQLRGPGYEHARMNELDLCGTSGLAPFYLALSRALDILLAHPQADAQRVAVAGLSGGGWQTIFISSLDTRVKFANPVAGYSSFRTRLRHFEDLGDSEQIPCDLATVADYTHLTALMAPRPTLLTYNAKDNCCFTAGDALPPLIEAASPVFRLYRADDHLRFHINSDPGDHNFGLDNRQALYRSLGDYFFPGATFERREMPCEDEIKSHAELQVALPTNNASFHSLALELSRSLPRQPRLPGWSVDAPHWQRKNRVRLREMVRARRSNATAVEAGGGELNGITARFWQLKVDGAWTVPVVELGASELKKTVLVVADQGRQGAVESIERLLRDGRRVLAMDPFGLGESRLSSHAHLFGLLVAAVGERPLGVQAGQVDAVARWAARQFPAAPVDLIALGPRASTVSLVAAALEEGAVARVELHGALGSLKEILEQDWGVNEKPELFCFGLLEAFDIRQLAALIAPRPVRFVAPSARARSELAELKRWYGMLGQPFDPLAEP